MFQFAHPTQSPLRQAITQAYRRDETEAVTDMLQRAQMTEAERTAASELARKLVTQVRANRTKANGVDALMHEFSLSSAEGIALMCLAEALLRVPDAATRNELIQDKLSGGNWQSQRICMGLAAHRQTHIPQQRHPSRQPEKRISQRRRTADSQKHRLRHAPDGQTICQRANHRRSPCQRQRARKNGLPLFL